MIRDFSELQPETQFQTSYHNQKRNEGDLHKVLPITAFVIKSSDRFPVAPPKKDLLCKVLVVGSMNQSKSQIGTQINLIEIN